MVDRGTGSGSSSNTPTLVKPSLPNSNKGDISNLLPLQLIKSETIPPSPNRGTIDWLEEYIGLSWIAYGAASLLVISHFPSPPSQQTPSLVIGPIHRQVIELSNHDDSVVKAVKWCPSVPSHGEIAVAIHNCICLCSDTSPNTVSQGGSFDWIQVAVLVQGFTVEAICWTGSGDGIISAGTEVVLWKRKGRSWEIAWKFAPQQPQTMVSATWSTGGPVATLAASMSESSSRQGGANRSVLVCQVDEKSSLLKSELRHPQPVLMLQWRPCFGVHSQRKDVLLTSSVDGTVRLWSEIDSGRARNTKQSYHVTAVIEINQSLCATLGVDAFVTWAAEFKSYTDEAGVRWCSTSEPSAYDMPGRCDWLIVYGPGMSVTFWAIHCLDDISPLRFPRVTLWKTLDLASFDNSTSTNMSLLIKAVISRTQLHGPPTMCSLFQFSDNSLGWSNLYTIEPHKVQGESLCLDGHSGNIVQVAVHSHACEVKLAVSLDSNGLLLFWHLSTISSCSLGMPASVLPTWKQIGKMAAKHLFCAEYTCLSWAPSVLLDYSVFVLGHSMGIDCFIVEIAESKSEKIVHHKLCTIPFTGYNRVDGPTKICAIPLPSTCPKTFISNHFMLVGVWMNEFQALSWKVTMHSADLSGTSCNCDFNVRLGVAESDLWRYESSFNGKRYFLVVEPCSSKISDLDNHGQVTSVAVVTPGSLMPSVQQKWPSPSALCNNFAPYQMATGYSDGSLRLWRSTHSNLLTLQSEMAYLPWELVGLFNVRQGPVTAISLSCCGGKIATISGGNNLENFSSLCIWRSVHVVHSGNFLLEDKIPLKGVVVALHWFSIGNGQLLLGVCLQNEFQVYAQRSSESQTLVKSGKLLETDNWCCIATGSTCLPARDFLWGPSASPVVVHERYLCIFSKWSFHTDKKHPAACYIHCSKDNTPNIKDQTDECSFSAVYSNSDTCSVNDVSLDGVSIRCNPELPSKLNLKSDYPTSSMVLQQDDSGTSRGPRSILEVAGKLRGLLPVYHPEALLLNLYSGNYRRACVAVRHLVEYLTSVDTSVACDKTHDSKMPYFTTPQMHLSKYFDEPSSAGSGDKGLSWGRGTAILSPAAHFQINSINFVGHDVDSNGSSNARSFGSGKSEISGFMETIEKFNDIPAITSTERTQLLALLDLLTEINDSSSSSAYGSLDESGRRFWVTLRFRQLHFRRSFGGLLVKDELAVDSGMIGWAFQSDCQDNLITSFLSNEPSWQEMRNLGAGFWFTDATQLRTRAEKLARSQYLKNKDPKDCALLYVALNRTKVLAGLCKISKDEKDKPLVGFLSRDFQDERNKAAALKNAYVLMGRHQLELAIAFFLLGGDASSAVSVCAKTLGDEQLALVICRLIEGKGGPLEHHLISKFLLPAAMERGDYWLVSLFEWNLGNYAQSFLNLLGFKKDTPMNKLALSSNQAAFKDPKVGQYCQILATKNLLKNSIGDSAALVLARWAALMTSTALNRRGLPIEALQCLSSSLNTIEGKDEANAADLEHHGISPGILEEFNDASNWLSADVALHLESYDKLDLALHYLSNLIMEHPSWNNTLLLPHKPFICSEECRNCQYKPKLEKFHQKLNAGLATFEQKFSFSFVDMLNMILVYSCNDGTLFLGYHILHGYTSRECPQDVSHTLDSIFQYPPLPKLFMKATKEVSCLFARYLMFCSIIYSSLNESFPACKVLYSNGSQKFHVWDLYMKSSMQLLENFRATLKMYYPSLLKEDVMMKTLAVVDLFEYYTIFSLVWRQKSLKGLILMISPILSAYNDGRAPSEADVGNLKKYLCQNVEVMISHSSEVSVSECKQLQHRQSKELLISIPDDERWKILGASLWRHLFNFTSTLSKSFPDSQLHNWSSRKSLDSISSSVYVNGSSQSDIECTREAFNQVPVIFANLLGNTLAYIASSHAKQLASGIVLKLEKGLHVPTLVWLEKSDRSPSRSFNKHDIDSLQLLSNGNEASLDLLWEISVDPVEIRKAILEERKSFLQCFSQKRLKGWTDVHKGTQRGYDKGDTSSDDQDSSFIGSSFKGDGDSFDERHSQDRGFHKPRGNVSALVQDGTYFQNPEEIYKRNGELLEAMCINPINQHQAAVASNKKGILFVKCKYEESSEDHSEYIWSQADWPRNGWAGSESTPVPTFVSPGIGLGSKKGAHLGLGGATLGLGSLVRPGGHLKGNRAFGLPGYGGAGAPELGWGTQEDFEFVDPPATVDNISTRALSSHPSRPFFLTGSSNTHIYLWEFGKEKASATYGVLPAANVPPPYALASISALQFDHCGHRFVTAALDGTICTWQLEVGGRSNIRPTESSLCFNGHASDVTYVAASGSVVGAAGYGSNDVNVVIWDTLAPTTTSQASLICHEGGARSICVLDKNLGGGSISPLILTGGKGGDVGMHDFRFIATGKTKRHKNETHSGEESSRGMLWYIPKAHLGSVTRIATIPDTSLFLTGSKDGDVKLWDAKKASLVFHWPKLHERHTFLQPSSRGFGGIVRAGVTDIQVDPHGFLTCGGDGTVKMVQIRDFTLP